MQRLKILTWHVHGSYLDAITSTQHDWYLPVGVDAYPGRRWSSPEWVHDIEDAAVADLDLDLVIFQSERNYREDQYRVLSEQQRRLPRIFLEHNTPRPHPVDSNHVVDDEHTLLVHVTHFNRLMWNNRRTPTTVIEHSVAFDRTIRYDGSLERGITVINGMQHRPRIAGHDLFVQARDALPLDAAGIGTEEFGGLGDIKYRDLHRRMAQYRFLFSPVRYTSLPLAVVEAMTIGMPVVALATTELPTVIRDGHNGYVSCDIQVLIERMQSLLRNPEEARRLGDNARITAEQRFGLDRFVDDWNRAFERAIELA
jgi:hypothetical protein